MTVKTDTTYLKPGDHDIIARKLGVTRSAVSGVATGHHKSKRIQRAIIAFNEARRIEEEREIEELCSSVNKEALTDFNQTA